MAEVDRAVPPRARSADARPLAIARAFLSRLGPGLITGASDDDPSGIGTYSQVGSQFGYALLWTALFTYPLMAGVQELCGRIALQTGTGLGASLTRKFPRPLVGAAVLALFAANTFNLGADLAAIAAGGQLLAFGRIPTWPLVLVVAGGLFAFELRSSYRTVFATFRWLTLALFAYLAAAVLVHPNALAVATATLVPTVRGDPAFVSALVAVLGTTISPYLFFWQASSGVDELRAHGYDPLRLRPGAKRGRLVALRTDVATGMGLSQVVMYAIILVTGTVLFGHTSGALLTAPQAASALGPLAGPYAQELFAVGLIGAGLLSVPILSGSAAYAIREFFGLPGSFRDTRLAAAPRFYGVIALSTVIGVALNFVGIGAIAALYLAAIVNGLVAPPLLVLIVLLGSDRRLMGPLASGRASRALTWAAAAAMSAAAVALVALSLR